MAREEHGREDLLREAVALVERFELELAGGQRVVGGFRADGCASDYFNSSGDPAWHFNSHGQLRRAFVAGFLYKADRGRLVRLDRRRSTEAVELLRHECTADETAAILAQSAGDLAALEQALRTGTFTLIGQVPANEPVLNRMRGWLAQLPRPLALALTPHAR